MLDDEFSDAVDQWLQERCEIGSQYPGERGRDLAEDFEGWWYSSWVGPYKGAFLGVMVESLVPRYEEDGVTFHGSEDDPEIALFKGIKLLD